VDFARTIVRELLTSNWALVGGDFNSKSVWIASQDELIGGSDEETARMRATHAGMRGRSQPEIAEMESAFTNARREVWENDLSRWSHAFPWPGDFVFLRNRLHAVQYTNDQSGVIGSDHPTIRVLLMRR
jgi:endonuclease/exonuclease/phosphatase (EEP) superfamily protein YafD